MVAWLEYYYSRRDATLKIVSNGLESVNCFLIETVEVPINLKQFHLPSAFVGFHQSASRIPLQYLRALAALLCHCTRSHSIASAHPLPSSFHHV